MAGYVRLANWDPRYLNLLWNLVNVSSPDDTNTAVDATPPLPSSYTIWHTLTQEPLMYAYAPPPTFCHPLCQYSWPASLVRLKPIRGSGMRSSQKTSTPNALSSLLTSETTDTLSNTVLLKHHHTVLICNFSGLEPSMRQATCSLISTNIRYLVLRQRLARLEAEALQNWKEVKEADTLLGTTYGPLLNLSRLSNLTVQAISHSLWRRCRKISH